MRHLLTQLKLCESKVKIHGRIPSIKLMPWTRFVPLAIANGQGEGGPRQILWEDGHRNSYCVGILDSVTSKQLEALGKVPGVTFVAILFSDILRSARKNKIEELSVNILGPEHLADEVGSLLAEDCGYLQHPLYLDRGIPYINPHYFYIGKTREDLRHLIGPSPTSPLERQAVRLRLGLNDTLESLDDSGSSTINSMTSIAAHLLVTPLKE